MSQNRNKLIELFIGNLANSVLHGVLEKAIKDKELSKRYTKELLNSFNLAQKYREKINPVDTPLLLSDTVYIKDKIIRKVHAELRLRTARGYENLDASIVKGFVENSLKELKVVD